MNVATLRRRLSFLEIPLLIAAFYLFYIFTDIKTIGYAVGVVGGVGIVALTFFKRYRESTRLQAVATIACA